MQARIAAAVASLAYFALFGDRVDITAALVGGYGLLMVLAQLCLLPRYLRLRFAPSHRERKKASSGPATP